MTTISEPTRWDRTLYRGTDHAWTLRRTDEAGLPLIPSSAQAQIRNRAGGELWVETTITIDPIAGWITVSIPVAATASEAWSRRTTGVWDLEVIVAGNRYRWAHGRVTVSQDVTK